VEKAKVEKLKIPGYTRQTIQGAVLQAINNQVKEMDHKSVRLIGKGRAEYKEESSIFSRCPAALVNRSSSRVGELWGTLVKEFRAAPIP